MLRWDDSGETPTPSVSRRDVQALRETFVHHQAESWAMIANNGRHADVRAIAVGQREPTKEQGRVLNLIRSNCLRYARLLGEDGFAEMSDRAIASVAYAIAVQDDRG